MAYYDFTGVCPCCGGTDFWDDETAYGCNNPRCRWSSAFGPNKQQPMPRERFEQLVQHRKGNSQ